MACSSIPYGSLSHLLHSTQLAPYHLSTSCIFPALASPWTQILHIHITNHSSPAVILALHCSPSSSINHLSSICVYSSCTHTYTAPHTPFDTACYASSIGLDNGRKFAASMRLLSSSTSSFCAMSSSPFTPPMFPPRIEASLQHCTTSNSAPPPWSRHLLRRCATATTAAVLLLTQLPALHSLSQHLLMPQ